jgi:hypothetical protein
MAFGRIVLARAFAGPGKRAARANVLDALLPSGELTAAMSRRSQRALEAGGFETIEVSRSQAARVVRMRRIAVGDETAQSAQRKPEPAGGHRTGAEPDGDTPLGDRL